jgi:hypothetical protein
MPSGSTSDDEQRIEGGETPREFCTRRRTKTDKRREKRGFSTKHALPEERAAWCKQATDHKSLQQFMANQYQDQRRRITPHRNGKSINDRCD